MSPVILHAESTLTDRYQTTIPQKVRDALGLSKRDKISYTLHQNGTVGISRVAPEEEEVDPVMDKFLDFLADGIANHPQSIKPLTSTLKARMTSLVEGVEFDIDAPLPDEDE